MDKEHRDTIIIILKKKRVNYSLTLLINLVSLIITSFESEDLIKVKPGYEVTLKVAKEIQKDMKKDKMYEPSWTVDFTNKKYKI